LRIIGVVAMATPTPILAKMRPQSVTGTLDLLEEDAKYDKLRSLLLYSSRITSWKFVCSKCYDKVYIYAAANKHLV
jgi:hypothetical protein